MIIVDECHHAAARQYESVLKRFGVIGNTEASGWASADCLYAMRTGSVSGESQKRKSKPTAYA